MTVAVSHHAIDRYIERVAPVDRISARDTMLAAARGIETAARFGGHVVRLANGARLVTRGRDPVHVVTVLGPGHIVGGKHPHFGDDSEDGWGGR